MYLLVSAVFRVLHITSAENQKCCQIVVNVGLLLSAYTLIALLKNVQI